MNYSSSLLWLLFVGLFWSFTFPETACDTTLPTETFEQLLVEIDTKRYSKKKLTTAKTGIEDYCLSVAQAKAIVEKMPFESTRLDFASYALHHIVDLESIESLYEPFLFSSSVEQLKEKLNEISTSTLR
ncbi:MAG: DUF4476 domain-containing protein [Bacteroidota bacterium]